MPLKKKQFVGNYEMGVTILSVLAYKFTLGLWNFSKNGSISSDHLDLI